MSAQIINAADRFRKSSNGEDQLDYLRRMNRQRANVVTATGIGWAHECDQAIDYGGQPITVSIIKGQSCPLCGKSEPQA